MNELLRSFIAHQCIDISKLYIDFSMEDLELLVMDVLKNKVSTGLPNSMINIEVDEFADSDEGITAFMISLTNLSNEEHLELSELLSPESEMDYVDAGVTFETDKVLSLLLEGVNDFESPFIQIITKSGESHIYRVFARKNVETSVKLHIYFPGVVTSDEVHKKLSKLLGEDISFQIHETNIQ